MTLCLKKAEESAGVFDDVGAGDGRALDAVVEGDEGAGAKAACDAGGNNVGGCVPVAWEEVAEDERVAPAGDLTGLERPDGTEGGRTNRRASGSRPVTSAI